MDIVSAVSARLFKSSTDRQLAKCAAMLNKTPKPGCEAAVLQPLFTIASTCIRDNNGNCFNKTIDLVRQAYDQGLARDSEPIHIKNLISYAIAADNYSYIEQVLSLMQRMPDTLPRNAWGLLGEEIVAVAILLFKARRQALMGKIIDIMFVIIHKVEPGGEIFPTVLKSLKMLGVIVIRYRDTIFFQTICEKYALWASYTAVLDLPKEAIWPLQTEWLHRVAASDHPDIFAAWLNVTQVLLDATQIDKSGWEYFFREWSQIIGQTALNPYSKLRTPLISGILSAAEKTGEIVIVREAVQRIAQNLCCVIWIHDFDKNFPLLLPLLEFGRKFFQEEIKLRGTMNDFRRQILFAVACQTIIITDHIARQKLTMLCGDILTEFYHHWVADSQLVSSPKNIKKYCQFLLLYWQRSRFRPANSCNEFEVLNNSNLLADNEIEFFSYLL